MTYGNYYSSNIPSMENRVNHIQQRLNALNNSSNFNGWNNQPNQMFLKGNMVTSFDEIKALPPSFDGSLSYYPTTDGKAIYVTKLAPDGTKEIMEYMLKPKEVVEEKPQPKNDKNYLDELEIRVSKIEETLENKVNSIEENLENKVAQIEETLETLTASNKKKEVKGATTTTTNAK